MLFPFFPHHPPPHPRVPDCPGLENFEEESVSALFEAELKALSHLRRLEGNKGIKKQKVPLPDDDKGLGTFLSLLCHPSFLSSQENLARQ